MKTLFVLIICFFAGAVYAQPDWTVVTYTNSTTAYGIVTINGEPAVIGDWVGAFVGEECRAAQEVIINEESTFMNLQIQGESVEIVSLRVWYSSEGQELDVFLNVKSNPENTTGTPPDYLEISAENTLSFPEFQHIF